VSAGRIVPTELGAAFGDDLVARFLVDDPTADTSSTSNAVATPGAE
jgi:hypothetical protein